MSLKAKFTLIGMTVVLIVIFSAVENYISLHAVEQEAQQVEIASELQQNHMDGDMMHDAVRGDVMKAALGVRARNTKMVDEAREEAREHGARFLGNLHKNLELPIPEDLKDLLKKEEPDLKSYIQLAATATTAAVEDLKNDTYQIDILLPEVEKAFVLLENKQGEISEKITTYIKAKKDHQMELIHSVDSLTAWLSLLTVIVSLSIPLFSRMALFTPLDILIKANQKLAGGDIALEVPFTERSDEIGQLAATLQVFKHAEEEKRELQRGQEYQKKLAEDEKKKAMAELATKFQQQVGSIIASVSAAATQLQATAESMTGMAEETSKQANTVAAASEEATTNVQTVSSATEELSSSVREIQQRVSQANVMIQEASHQATITNKKVAGLTDAATKIGDVVQMITDIAAQTNLLALNATIEAARAGDAGKGFAVVASEVKNLAGQTARATEEISQQIKNIQDETRNSAAAINSITRAIEDVNQTSTAIAAAVEEQGSATQEIARNITEASQGTQEVSHSIAKVSDAAQRTGSASSQVLAAACELSKNGEFLRKQVDQFLSTLRAS